MQLFVKQGENFGISIIWIGQRLEFARILVTLLKKQQRRLGRRLGEKIREKLANLIPLYLRSSPRVSLQAVVGGEDSIQPIHFYIST